eukprot:5770213-Alexandrium_andersonii.AAC.1
MDPYLLQQFAALGLSLQGPSGCMGTREAWNLLARVRERWLADCGWRHEWKVAVTQLVRAFSSGGDVAPLQPRHQEELEHFLRILELW